MASSRLITLGFWHKNLEVCKAAVITFWDWTDVRCEETKKEKEINHLQVEASLTNNAPVPDTVFSLVIHGDMMMDRARQITINTREWEHSSGIKQRASTGYKTKSGPHFHLGFQSTLAELVGKSTDNANSSGFYWPIRTSAPNLPRKRHELNQLKRTIRVGPIKARTGQPISCWQLHSRKHANKIIHDCVIFRFSWTRFCAYLVVLA